jgi:hypothetical protein
MKSLQLFVILLLISFILFLIFHLDLIESKEGFDPAVPECQVYNETTRSYGSNVPGCYADVQPDDYLSFPSEFASDDYILKTKIVTPVCPNNPYDRIGSNVDEPIAPIAPAPAPEQVAPQVNKMEPLPSNQAELSKDSSIKVPNMPENQDYMLTPQVAQKPTEPVPATKEDTKSSPDTCPPCPACERCPEPVVDCKKVVHYKDQQYPLPVIADFSHFSRF